VSGFEFSTEADGTVSPESAVFQALGFASLCWEDMSGAGVFQSDKAKEAGDALVAYFHELVTNAYDDGYSDGDSYGYDNGYADGLDSREVD
jgi:hypothetical protein